MPCEARFVGAHERRLKRPAVPPWVGAMLLSALVILPGHPVAAQSDCASGCLKHETRSEGNWSADAVPSETDTAEDLTVVTIAADVSEVVYNLDHDVFALDDLSFTVSRTGPTLAATEVPLTLTQNRRFLPVGALSRTVTIAVGAASASLTIAQSEFTGTPKNDGTLTAEVGAGNGYEVGTDDTASVAMKYVFPAVIGRLDRSEYRFREDQGAARFVVIAETATGVPSPDRTLRFP